MRFSAICDFVALVLDLIEQKFYNISVIIRNTFLSVRIEMAPEISTKNAKLPQAKRIQLGSELFLPLFLRNNSIPLPKSSRFVPRSLEKSA